VKHVQNTFGTNTYVRSKFSCERLSHDLCANTHAHSLEQFRGNIVYRYTHIKIVLYHQSWAGSISE